MDGARIIVGDCIEGLGTLEPKSVQTCVTSPPYWGLRDYGHDGQLGLEKTPEEYVENMVEVFRAVRRVLRDDGVLWLNLGDSFFGPKGGKWDKDEYRPARKDEWLKRPAPAAHPTLKVKDLVGIPWRVALALQSDGWYLRSDVIWKKPNPMPESVTDRPTKAHEYVFLLSKGPRYFYDADAVKERALQPVGDARSTGQGKRLNADAGAGKYQTDLRKSILGSNQGSPWRNKRSVWTVTTQPYPGAHFAVMPPKLVEPCILAGSRLGDTVLDPFAGTATVGVVALQHGRKFVGCELNPEYAKLAEERLAKDAGQSLMFTPQGEAV